MGRRMSASTTVRGLDGATFEVHHAPGASLANIKLLIAERTGIDPAQQQLASGGRTVADDDASMEGDDPEREAALRLQDDTAADLMRRFGRSTAQKAHRLPKGARPARRGQPPGLRNLGGSSCYLNAALQSLLAVDELAEPEIYRARRRDRKQQGGEGATLTNPSQHSAAREKLSSQLNVAIIIVIHRRNKIHGPGREA